MDYIIIALVFMAVIFILKVMKSVFKVLLALVILVFVAYNLDAMGIVDIGPLLDTLGI